MSEIAVPDKCESCPVRWKNFQYLTDEEMKLVNENRFEATFKRGEIIIKQGSPVSSVLFIESGMAKSFYEGKEAEKNFIMDILVPGGVIIGPGAYNGSKYAYSVSALTMLKVCFITFDIFNQLVRKNGDFAEGLIKYLCSGSLRSNMRMINITQKKMPGRLADILLYFSDEIFRSDEFEMILSRQELGEMTNMVKESVVRILKDMEDMGVISSESSNIKITDKGKLRMIAEKG
jgi:CRP/FNR family transcriptional regulator